MSGEAAEPIAPVAEPDAAPPDAAAAPAPTAPAAPAAPAAPVFGQEPWCGDPSGEPVYRNVAVALFVFFERSFVWGRGFLNTIEETDLL